jgi:hypothetical protein
MKDEGKNRVKLNNFSATPSSFILHPSKGGRKSC